MACLAVDANQLGFPVAHSCTTNTGASASARPIGRRQGHGKANLGAGERGRGWLWGRGVMSTQDEVRAVWRASEGETQDARAMSPPYTNLRQPHLQAPAECKDGPSARKAPPFQHLTAHHRHIFFHTTALERPLPRARPAGRPLPLNKPTAAPLPRPNFSRATLAAKQQNAAQTQVQKQVEERRRLNFKRNRNRKKFGRARCAGRAPLARRAPH